MEKGGERGGNKVGVGVEAAFDFKVKARMGGLASARDVRQGGQAVAKRTATARAYTATRNKTENKRRRRGCGGRRALRGAAVRARLHAPWARRGRWSWST